jgi:hypothetical protein
LRTGPKEEEVTGEFNVSSVKRMRAIVEENREKCLR